MSNRKKKSAFSWAIDGGGGKILGWLSERGKLKVSRHYFARFLTIAFGSSAGWHCSARLRTVALGLVRRSERLLSARSVRVVGQLPAERPL